MAKENMFVNRKVMACSIAIVIMLIGFISYKTLSVEQYPDIAPPTVCVSTTYTGADANAAMQSVIMPLEESINGVQDMLYMSSEASSTGEVSINVYFNQGTDPDMNTVNVQNRVSAALGLMPEEVTKVGVTVNKKQNSILQISGLVSRDGKFDQDFITNYLDINVKPRILRVTGVGGVNVLGNTYSLRIWMKPNVMSQYGLTPNDVIYAINTQNLVAATGSLGEHSENTYQYTMEYKGRLTSLSEFENIVVRATENGQVMRLKDVADVELGALSYSFTSTIGNQPGVMFIVNQSAGANATLVNAQINQILKDVERELPPGLEFTTMLTSDDFLFAAMHNVVETLIIAILLVILVVYFFLQDFKSTLIPSISIIVSLLGTFAVVKMAGFSLNILTLFALVLAIGTVVDDAIVVVEAVMAKLEGGQYSSARQATLDAMSEVSMAVISCTLVFMAVFIPVTFMPGTSGTFFTQFGITIASSVGLSCVCAMTLCPALCVMLMRPKAESETEKKNISYYVKAAYDASYSALLGKYKSWVGKFLNHRKVAWFILVVALGLMFYLMKTMPAGLVPQEDQGVMLVNVTVPAGSTLHETDEILARIEKKLDAIPEVESYSHVSGFGMISGTDPSYGMLIVRLKPWDERSGAAHSIDMVMWKLYAACEDIKEATIMPFQMPQIPGYGTSNSVELVLEDRQGGDMSVFNEYANKFLAALQQREEVQMAISTYSESFPKYTVEVDNVQCERAGVSVQEVLNTLGSFCGGAYIGNYNQYGKVYRVMLCASPEYRLDPSSLNNIFLRVKDEMVPISQFVTLQSKVGSSTQKRFNLYQSITCQINCAPGYSEGQVHQVIDEVAKEIFPAGYGYEYGGMSRELEGNSKSNATAVIYIISIFLIYLILACLYESWFIPFAVLLSVPFGLMGSFLFSKLCGMDNNIYLQTGVIMLIGLLAKTAILISEFAVEKHKQGMSVIEAAKSACEDRFRPILMTVFTMIVGMIPLIIEGGAGAHGNRSLAIGVVGGMSIGIIAILFVVPVFYIVFQNLHDKFQGEKQVSADTPKLSTILVIAFMAVSMTSCGIYKKYTPQTQVQDNLYGTDSLVAAHMKGDSSIATLSWRAIFSDPYLQNLIDTALVRNADLNVARENVKQAEAALLAAKLAFLPSFSVAPQGGISSFGGQSAGWTYNIPLSASWEVEVFGSITQRKRQTDALKRQAEDVQQATQAQLVAAVALNYYQLMLLDHELDIMLYTRSLWQKSLETEEALMQNGRAYMPAVQQMQAAMCDVDEQLLTLRREIHRSENNLCLLLNYAPQSLPRAAWRQFDTPDLHLGAPVDLLSNRPDVRAAERQLEAAYYITQQARSAFLPKLTLSGVLGWTNSNGSAVVNPGQLLMNALGQLTQPIFQQGKLIAQLRIAKSQQEQAKLQYTQKVLQAGNEVNNALADYQVAKRKDDVYKQKVEALQGAYDGTIELQLNGKAIYLEVLRAQEDLLSAQLAEANNFYTGIEALITLYTALGGGTK